MLLIFIIAYLGVTIWIGTWAARKVRSAGDFMLAGRSLPLALTSAALFATWFGSETVFGASAQFIEGGLLGVIEDPFGAALCLVLFGMFFAKKLYNYKLLTLADYFRARFGKSVELPVSVLIALPYIGYIAAQLVAMGLILHVVTELPMTWGVIFSSGVVTFYTFRGGMWAISITDFVQGIIIVVGLVVLSIELLHASGGFARVWNSLPPGRLQFLPDPDFKSVISYFAAWSVLGLGSIPSQDVFQRAMSARSDRIAALSCYIAALLYLTIAMLPLWISVCVGYLYPDQLGGDTQLSLPLMVLEHTPITVQVLFFGSLLSAIMSTTSSAMLAPSSVLSENIIKPFIGSKLTDRQLLRLTRVGIVLFSCVATVMACVRTNIYELVGESSIISLVSLFVPLTLGLYWRRTSTAGALAGMIGGIITWIIFEVLDTVLPSLVPATLVSLAACVVVSYLKPSV